MYLKHFQLNAKPFQITADPKFLWLGEKHKEALATLRYGILDNRGFLLLTGEVGTGKTILINRLITMLEMDTVVATLPDPDLVSMDFYNLLAHGLKMNRTFDSKGAFLIHLRDFLHQSYANRKQVLLIIDESQRLNHRLMEDIRVLSNIERHDHKLINIFFVGQQEFNNILTAPQNKALAQRITVRYHIPPLDLNEVGLYIQHRLKVAGTTDSIFNDKAVNAIFQFSGGIPRLINIICDHALLTAYARGVKQIDEQIITECAQELRIPIKPPIPREDQQKRAADTRAITNATAREARDKATGTPLGRGAMPPPASSRRQGTRARSPLWKFFYAGIALLLVALAAFLIPNFTVGRQPRWDAEELTPQRYRTDLERERALLAERMKTGGENEPDSQAGPSQETAASEQHAGPRRSGPPIGEIEPLPLIKEKITIRFELNSNEIDHLSYDVLDRVAAFLAKHPEQTVYVLGYTDTTGSAGYNERVSQFRANAVKSYLVGKGARADKIQVFAMGAENPIASNDTAAGRSQNRRVEIGFPRDPDTDR
jgi:general secretion pathway protein A